MPANTKVKLIVKNADAMPEEFESAEPSADRPWPPRGQVNGRPVVLAILIIVFREVLEAGHRHGRGPRDCRPKFLGVHRRGRRSAGRHAGRRLCRRLGRSGSRHGAGTLQRRDPGRRRRHAHLAQRLDDASRTGIGQAGRRCRSGHHRRNTVTLRTGDCDRRGCVAGGGGNRPVSLRHCERGRCPVAGGIDHRRCTRNRRFSRLARAFTLACCASHSAICSPSPTG